MFPGTLGQVSSKTQTESPEYTHKSGVQVLGKLIHYLRVFKSTPACKSFKEREEMLRPKQAKRENSSQYPHVKVEL